MHMLLIGEIVKQKSEEQQYLEMRILKLIEMNHESAEQMR